MGRVGIYDACNETRAGRRALINELRDVVQVLPLAILAPTQRETLRDRERWERAGVGGLYQERKWGYHPRRPSQHVCTRGGQG